MQGSPGDYPLGCSVHAALNVLICYPTARKVGSKTDNADAAVVSSHEGLLHNKSSRASGTSGRVRAAVRPNSLQQVARL